jgi:hypothetical protein
VNRIGVTILKRYYLSVITLLYYGRYIAPEVLGVITAPIPYLPTVFEKWRAYNEIPSDKTDVLVGKREV